MAIAIRQVQQATATSVSSLQLTLASDVLAGSVLLVVQRAPDDTTVPGDREVTCSDNGSNSYLGNPPNHIQNPELDGGLQGQVFVARNAVQGSRTVTLTLAAGTGRIHMIVYELTGAAFDGGNNPIVLASNSALGNSLTSLNTGNVTVPVGKTAFLLSYIASSANATWTTPTDWTASLSDVRQAEPLSASLRRAQGGRLR